MKETLHRGKTKEGEWVYGSLIPHNVMLYVYWQEEVGIEKGEDNYYAILTLNARRKDNRRARFDMHDVIPSTVGQYTTHLDKDGNKIFDGDIIFCEELREHFKALVKMNVDGIFLVPYPEKDYHSYYRFKSSWGDSCKIMGNIHDGMPERETMTIFPPEVCI